MAFFTPPSPRAQLRWILRFRFAGRLIRRAGRTAEQFGRRFIAGCGLGQTPDVSQMRRLDYRQLLKAAPSEVGAGPGAPLHLKPLALIIGPTVDGHVIPDAPERIFAAGREHPVPLMIGSTRDEMALFLLAARFPADEGKLPADAAHRLRGFCRPVL